MDGSKTIEERKILLKRCYRIIFNSNWSRKRFLEGLSDNTINSEKLLVFYQSARKQNNDIVKKKKKWITFVGKLNKAKGYDIFAKAIIKVLNKNTGWECKVVGDEKREKIELKHDKVELLGFKKHNYVLRLFKKTSIAVVCSRWEEPFGRTSLEASANGCAVIISNKGGLPETATNPLILKELSVEELTDKINYLINNNSLRKNLQTLSIKNFGKLESMLDIIRFALISPMKIIKVIKNHHKIMMRNKRRKAIKSKNKKNKITKSLIMIMNPLMVRLVMKMNPMMMRLVTKMNPMMMSLITKMNQIKRSHILKSLFNKMIKSFIAMTFTNKEFKTNMTINLNSNIINISRSQFKLLV